MRIIRPFGAALIVAAVWLYLAVTIYAAGPLIGGSLSATADAATVVSMATMPVLVQITADQGSVTPATLTLAPGQSGTVALQGAQTVTARMSSLGPVTPGGDTATATLSVKVHTIVPPAPFPWQPIGLLLLAILAGALIIRRLRVWEWRLSRKVGAQ